MKMINRYLPLMAAAILAVSCQKNDPQPVTPDDRDRFAVDMPQLSKVQVSTDRILSWSIPDDNDRIAVYSPESISAISTYVPYLFSPVDGGSTIAGKIQKSSTGSYWAVYPYFNSKNDSTQVATDGTVWQAFKAEQGADGVRNAVLLATAKDEKFKFDVQSSFFHFTMPSSLPDGMLIDKVEIRTNTDDFREEPLSVYACMNLQTRNVYVYSEDEYAKAKPSAVVSMQDKWCYQPGSSWYLACYPANLEKGITVTLYVGGEMYNQTIYPNAIDLRNPSAPTGVRYGGMVCELGELSPKSDTPEPYVYDEITPAFSPVYAIMDGATASTAVTNCTRSGNTVSFNKDSFYAVSGSAIDFENISWGAWTNNQMCFTVKSPVEGACIIYDIPVIETVKGDVEFTFGVNTAKPNSSGDVMTVYWSTDKTSWKKVDKVYNYAAKTSDKATGNTLDIRGFTAYTYADAIAEFSVSTPVTAGNYIYVKVNVPQNYASTSTATLRVNYGFCLAARTLNTSFPCSGDSRKVVFSENFADCLALPNLVQPFNWRYFSCFYNADGDKFAQSDSFSKKGWTRAGNATKLRGCVLSGSATDASAIRGALITPALSSLEGTCDVVLTFKVAPFRDHVTNSFDALTDVSVKVVGEGVAGRMVYPKGLTTDPQEWHVASCIVKGVNKDTKITIGDNTAGPRFMVDDVVVVLAE